MVRGIEPRDLATPDYHRCWGLHPTFVRLVRPNYALRGASRVVVNVVPLSGMPDQDRNTL